MELFLVQNFEHVFIWNFCDGETYFIPLVAEAWHVVILQLDFSWSLKSRRASLVLLILKVVVDHGSDLSSLQKSIVMFRFLLFHVNSPLEIRGQYLLESTCNC